MSFDEDISEWQEGWIFYWFYHLYLRSNDIRDQRLLDRSIFRSVTSSQSVGLFFSSVFCARDSLGRNSFRKNPRTTPHRRIQTVILQRSPIRNIPGPNLEGIANHRACFQSRTKTAFGWHHAHIVWREYASDLFLRARVYVTDVEQMGNRKYKASFLSTYVRKTHVVSSIPRTSHSRFIMSGLPRFHVDCSIEARKLKLRLYF